MLLLFPRGRLDRLVAELSPRATTDDLLGVSPKGVQIITTQIVMSILAVVWTGMRIWARHNRRISPFVVEDILCYFALVCWSKNPPSWSSAKVYSHILVTWS